MSKQLQIGQSDKVDQLKNVLKTRDENGMICVNDLHKVYGGDEKDKPNHFLKTSQSQIFSNWWNLDVS